MSAIDALKTISKRVLQKTTETTGNLKGNKFTGKINHHRRLQVNPKHPQGLHKQMRKHMETPREKHISPENW